MSISIVFVILPQKKILLLHYPLCLIKNIRALRIVDSVAYSRWHTDTY